MEEQHVLGESPLINYFSLFVLSFFSLSEARFLKWWLLAQHILCLVKKIAFEGKRKAQCYERATIPNFKIFSSREIERGGWEKNCKKTRIYGRFMELINLIYFPGFSSVIVLSLEIVTKIIFLTQIIMMFL